MAWQRSSNRQRGTALEGRDEGSVGDPRAFSREPGKGGVWDRVFSCMFFASAFKRKPKMPPSVNNSLKHRDRMETAAEERIQEKEARKRASRLFV